MRNKENICQLHDPICDNVFILNTCHNRAFLIKCNIPWYKQVEAKGATTDLTDLLNI